MPGGAPLRWQPGNGATTNGSVVFAAAYVTADRWTRATLQVTGGDAASRRVWLDGARVGSAPVDLSQGKHFLLVARVGSTVYDACVTTQLRKMKDRLEQR